MAIIPQKRLFGWNDIEELGELERLRLVLEYMPDEKLMQRLEEERGNGRNDYPVRCVWNSILAGIVYQHPSIESLRRELARNAQLRQLCGFDVTKGADAVPEAWVYTRFLRRLIQNYESVEEMFDCLVRKLYDMLPGFGNVLAVDGKAIRSRARRKNDKPADGRRDTDADIGVKSYRGKREDGTLWEKTKRWFGYKLHLLVDAEYELPVSFEVSRASRSEIKQGHKLVEKTNERTPEIMESCEYFTGDRGYDDGKLITKLWDGYGIKPVIDIRNVWRDGEKTRLVGGQQNIVYDYSGGVYCHCPETDKVRQMAFGGFEKDRESLKYRCPARHYGTNCKGKEECSKSSVRIALSQERRVFTPLARSSYTWKKIYKKRTAVERVNGRLDCSFNFEEHFIRGLAKMKLRCGLALTVMLAMAVGRIEEKKGRHLRSLVKAA